MDILFEANLGDEFNSQKRLRRLHGDSRAKLINRRLDQLRAAPNLGTMRTLPGRSHELKGDRKGIISIDLDGPYRLLFRPVHSPLPTKPDGGSDWAQVTAICVLGVEDTHE